MIRMRGNENGNKRHAGNGNEWQQNSVPMHTSSWQALKVSRCQ
jgi:hypothetical protein